MPEMPQTLAGFEFFREAVSRKRLRPQARGGQATAEDAPEQAIAELLYFVGDRAEVREKFAADGSHVTRIGPARALRIRWWWIRHRNHLRIAWVTQQARHWQRPHSILAAVDLLPEKAPAFGYPVLLDLAITYRVDDTEVFCRRFLFRDKRRKVTRWEVEQALGAFISRHIEEQISRPGMDRTVSDSGQLFWREDAVRNFFDDDTDLSTTLQGAIRARLGIEVSDLNLRGNPLKDYSADLMSLDAQFVERGGRVTDHTGLRKLLVGWLRAEGAAHSTHGVILRKFSFELASLLTGGDRQSEPRQESPPADPPRGQNWWQLQPLLLALATLVTAVLAYRYPPLNVLLSPPDDDLFGWALDYGPAAVDLLEFVYQVLNALAVAMSFVFTVVGVALWRSQKLVDAAWEEHKDDAVVDLELELRRKADDGRQRLNNAGSQAVEHLGQVRRATAEALRLLWLLDTGDARNAQSLRQFLNRYGSPVTFVVESARGAAPRLATLQQIKAGKVQVQFVPLVTGITMLGTDTADLRPILIYIQNGRYDAPFVVDAYPVASQQAEPRNRPTLTLDVRPLKVQLADDHVFHTVTLSYVRHLDLHETEASGAAPLPNEYQLVERAYRCLWLLDSAIPQDERRQIAGTIRTQMGAQAAAGTFEHRLLLCSDPDHLQGDGIDSEAVIRDLAQECGDPTLDCQLQTYLDAPVRLSHDGELPWECALRRALEICTRPGAAKVTRNLVILVGGMGPHRPVVREQWNSEFEWRYERYIEKNNDREPGLMEFQAKRRLHFSRYVVEPHLDWLQVLQQLRAHPDVLVVTGFHWRHPHETDARFAHLRDHWRQFWAEINHNNGGDLAGTLRMVYDQVEADATDVARAATSVTSPYVLPYVIPYPQEI